MSSVVVSCKIRPATECSTVAAGNATLEGVTIRVRGSIDRSDHDIRDLVRRV